MDKYKDVIGFIRNQYKTEDFIPLHEPRFRGNEKKYINECIDSTFVSSVGKFVDLFEQKVVEYTGAKHAVAAVNGTAALHIALILAGVKSNYEVITQPLTFIATANAITYTGAKPIFVDIDRETMGLSPSTLEGWLQNNVELRTQKTKQRIPFHTTKLQVAAFSPVFPCTLLAILVVLTKLLKFAINTISRLLKMQRKALAVITKGNTLEHLVN